MAFEGSTSSDVSWESLILHFAFCTLHFALPVAFVGTNAKCKMQNAKCKMYPPTTMMNDARE